MAHLQNTEIHSGQVDLSTTGDKFRWGPANAPFVITAYAVTVNAAVSSGAVNLAKRVTYGSDSGRVTQNTMTIASSIPAGGVAYRQLSTPVTINPGEEAVIAVGTALTGNTAAKVSLYGYYDMEHPRNLSMIRMI